MHELALTEGIISIVESEKKKHGFERVSDTYSYEAEIRRITKGEDDGSAPLMQY